MFCHCLIYRMDFSKCFEILSNRQHVDKDCPCCIPPDEALSLLKNDITGDEYSTELSTLSDLHLLERFADLQRKRMEVSFLFLMCFQMALYDCFPVDRSTGTSMINCRSFWKLNASLSIPVCATMSQSYFHLLVVGY